VPASGQIRKISLAFFSCSEVNFSLHEGETSFGKEEVSATVSYDDTEFGSARAAKSMDAQKSANRKKDRGMTCDA